MSEKISNSVHKGPRDTSACNNEWLKQGMVWADAYAWTGLDACKINSF